MPGGASNGVNAQPTESGEERPLVFTSFLSFDKTSLGVDAER
jgi:hypothetical protein